MLSQFKKNTLRIRTPKWNRPSFKDEQESIVSLYGKYTGNPLRRVGNVWMGLCPFHEETTPSFAIYEDTNSYYCYGCKKHGTAYWFKRMIEER